jgi:hypothetical protein
MHRPRVLEVCASSVAATSSSSGDAVVVEIELCVALDRLGGIFFYPLSILLFEI